MSEYKNDEKHNEMETHITKGGIGKFPNIISKTSGKTNDHLKLVVNEVDDSVSIYNASVSSVSSQFNYDDFVMRFTGDNKDNNFKKAMKRLNLIRVLIEKSIRFKKEELSEFKDNIEKGVIGQITNTDFDLQLLLEGKGTHVLKDSNNNYKIVTKEEPAAEGAQYFTPYTMMYDIMTEDGTEAGIKQLVQYLIKCGGSTEKKSITDGLNNISTTEGLTKDTYKTDFLDNVYTKVFETIATGNSEGTTEGTDQNPDTAEDPGIGANSTLGGQKSKTLKRKQQTHNKSRRRFAYGGRKAYEQRKKQRQQQKQN